MPSNCYIWFLYKMLEKHLWNGITLYLLVKILQLIHEIISFSEVLYERGVLKNFSEVTYKLTKESSGDVQSKDVLKNFEKLTEKHLCRNLFFNEVAGWKCETMRSSNWRCSVKKGFLKISQISQESLFNKEVAASRACNFIKKDSNTVGLSRFWLMLYVNIYIKNALACKVVILKKAIAETSILIWWLKILWLPFKMTSWGERFTMSLPYIYTIVYIVPFTYFWKWRFVNVDYKYYMHT